MFFASFLLSFFLFFFFLKLKIKIINCECTVFLWDEMIRIPSWLLLSWSNRKSPSWKLKSPRFNINFCLQCLLLLTSMSPFTEILEREISLIFFTHSLSKYIFHHLYHYSTKVHVIIIFSHSCQNVLYKIKIKSDHPCFKPFDNFPRTLQSSYHILPDLALG